MFNFCLIVYVKASGVLALFLLMQVLYYISSVIGPNLPPEQLASILSTLLDGLQGRTWDGKVISISFALEQSNHSITKAHMYMYVYK